MCKYLIDDAKMTQFHTNLQQWRNLSCIGINYRYECIILSNFRHELYTLYTRTSFSTTRERSQKIKWARISFRIRLCLGMECMISMRIIMYIFLLNSSEPAARHFVQQINARGFIHGKCRAIFVCMNVLEWKWKVGTNRRSRRIKMRLMTL